MIKKVFFILIIASLAAFASCESSDSYDISEGPSGALDIKIAGKTFVSAEEFDDWVVEKTINTYATDDSSTSEETVLKALTTGKFTYVFNSDGTYTLTTEYTFTDSFSGELKYDTTYTWVNSSGTSTDTNWTIYNTGDVFANYITYDKSGGVEIYNKFSTTRSFSGYSGNLKSKYITSGTWVEFEIPSDGFDDSVKGYKLTSTSRTYTVYSIEKLNWSTEQFEDESGTKDILDNLPNPIDPSDPEYRYYSPSYRFAATYDSSKTVASTYSLVDDDDTTTIIAAGKTADGEEQILIGETYFVEQEAK
jgi:hypothetical protein